MASKKRTASQLMEEIRYKAHLQSGAPYDRTKKHNDSPLVPVFVLIDRDGQDIREQFLWPIGDPAYDPATAASRLCNDLQLSQQYERAVEEHINVSLKPFKGWSGAAGERLVGLQVYVRNEDWALYDSVTWDLNDPTNTPEQYAALTTQALGLDGTWFEAITTTLRSILDDHLEDLRDFPEDVALLPPVQQAVLPAGSAAPPLPRISRYDPSRDLEAQRREARTARIESRRQEAVDRRWREEEDRRRREEVEWRRREEEETRRREEGDRAAKEGEDRRQAEEGERIRRESEDASRRGRAGGEAQHTQQPQPQQGLLPPGLQGRAELSPPQQPTALAGQQQQPNPQPSTPGTASQQLPQAMDLGTQSQQPSPPNNQTHQQLQQPAQPAAPQQLHASTQLQTKTTNQLSEANQPLPMSPSHQLPSPPDQLLQPGALRGGPQQLPPSATPPPTSPRSPHSWPVNPLATQQQLAHATHPLPTNLAMAGLPHLAPQLLPTHLPPVMSPTRTATAQPLHLAPDQPPARATGSPPIDPSPAQLPSTAAAQTAHPAPDPSPASVADAQPTSPGYVQPPESSVTTQPITRGGQQLPSQPTQPPQAATPAAAQPPSSPSPQQPVVAGDTQPPPSPSAQGLDGEAQQTPTAGATALGGVTQVSTAAGRQGTSPTGAPPVAPSPPQQPADAQPHELAFSFPVQQLQPAASVELLAAFPSLAHVQPPQRPAAASATQLHQLQPAASEELLAAFPSLAHAQPPLQPEVADAADGTAGPQSSMAHAEPAVLPGHLAAEHPKSQPTTTVPSSAALFPIPALSLPDTHLGEQPPEGVAPPGLLLPPGMGHLATSPPLTTTVPPPPPRPPSN